MAKRIAVLGNDPRQTWVARELQAKGLQVATFGVPEWTDFSSLSRTVEQADAVALPMTPWQDWEGLLPHLKPGTMVFGGKLPPDLPGSLRRADYSASETVAAYNAVPTSEGAIAIAMEKLPVTLWQSSCLVVGFGRIGKVLTRQLQGLGAFVTVAARKASDRAMAEALGARSDETGVYRLGLDYDCIFNTVPAMVLPRQQLVRTMADCLLLDLASKPGGMDFAACQDFHRQAIHALSLPGQAAPATAGKIISDFILDALE